MKNVSASIRPNMALALFSTLTTAVVHVQLFRGDALGFWTPLIWVMALTILVLPMLLDIESDAPSTLARYAMFACMLLSLKTMQVFGIQDESLATVLLLVWRWADVALMWCNTQRCES